MKQMTFLKACLVADQAKKKKRNWENAFQTWSNEHGTAPNNITSYGCCGYGAMCDWCDGEYVGRPCVRALNAMCREKGIHIDYEAMEYEAAWRGDGI